MRLEKVGKIRPAGTISREVMRACTARQMVVCLFPNTTLFFPGPQAHWERCSSAQSVCKVPPIRQEIQVDEAPSFRKHAVEILMLVWLDSSRVHICLLVRGKEVQVWYNETTKKSGMHIATSKQREMINGSRTQRAP